MIDKSHELPVVRQAELLELSHSNVYYLPRPVTDADLVLMRRIDELHLNYPFAGARMLRDMLKLEGPCHWPPARGHADGEDGDCGDLPQAQHQHAAPGPSDLSVPSQGPYHRPAEPGLGDRLDVYPDEARVRLPGGDH